MCYVAEMQYFQGLESFWTRANFDVFIPWRFIGTRVAEEWSVRDVK